MQGLGFRVDDSRFRVQGLGFRVQGSGFRIQGLGFRVQGYLIGCLKYFGKVWGVVSLT